MIKSYKTVYELLKNKSRWTQKACARDKDDIITNIENEDACKFCLFGGIKLIYRYPEDIHIIKRIVNIVRMEIGVFNDKSTHKEVLDLVAKLEI